MTRQYANRLGAKLFLFCAITFALPMAAMACPLCHSPTGREVRLGIFDDQFWGTLLAVISPFPILLLGLATYHCGMPTFGKNATSTGRLDQNTTNKDQDEPDE